MAEKTAIEWTDSTFNPWWGCTKISPACDFCYAADLDKRTGGNHWGNVPRRRTGEHNWNEPRRWQKKAREFFEQYRRRRRVFCASMADVFDNQVPTEWRDDLWALIRECPDLDWLLLTKRPQNIQKMLPSFARELAARLWLGTTVEDQLRADQNIPVLLSVTPRPAVFFISAEPMVGPIDLTHIKRPPAHGQVIGTIDALRGWTRATSHGYRESDWAAKLDWVINGGESGPHARDHDVEWFRSLRDQCADAGTPYHFKQHGEWIDAENVVYLPDAERGIFDDRRRGNFGTVRVGKKVAGRMLDGRTHDGFPLPVAA